MQENCFKQKSTSKEKEINELKSILNTNASIKSQMSSIYHEPKDIENEKVPEGEIFSYMDNNDINVKKKKLKKKSLSLLERKLSSLSSINNRRNILRVNNINRSHNSKNNSKRVNINKINKIEIQNYISNPKNDANSEFKHKSFAKIYYSDSNTKRTKNDNSIKVKEKIKKSCYYNYNSINSLRTKKIDKSISRSMPSKRGIEESFGKNYFWNINRSDISSNINKKISKDKSVIKNKILINYNTNIINTNISLDKSSINKKLKNSLEEKINDVTRNKNKKNSIKRTISAYYDKRDKNSLFLEKVKTRRENSIRHSNILNIDKNNSLKFKKNGYYNLNSGYNSNFFRKKFPQINNAPQKNKKPQKIKKMKIKLKDNSMLNIKNDFTKDFKNKFSFIQAYTGKSPYEERKNCRLIKDRPALNINKNIISIKKNPNYDSNINKTLKSNPYNVGLTYRKYKNFDKLTALYDKNLSKNENKVKINKLNINSSNRTNQSLRNFIFSKCTSNSNLA